MNSEDNYWFKRNTGYLDVMSNEDCIIKF